jgi:hypothetical protein
MASASKLPKSTRTALGKQGAKIGEEEAPDFPRLTLPVSAYITPGKKAEPAASQPLPDSEERLAAAG